MFAWKQTHSEMIDVFGLPLQPNEHFLHSSLQQYLCSVRSETEENEIKRQTHKSRWWQVLTLEEDEELHGEDFRFLNGDGSKGLLIEFSVLFREMSSVTSP